MPRFREEFEEGSTQSGSDSSSDEEDAAPVQPVAKRKKAAAQEPSLQALQDAGFRPGPSILTVREQIAEPTYDWGTGKRGAIDEADDDFEERERTRAAATEATEVSAKRAVDARERAAAAREAERADHAMAQQTRRDTFQQREKRKRELGQAKKGKNYVEEEKRLLRQHNIYSGFDN